MENFFGHPKEEIFHRQESTDTGGFIAELEGYIRWYNFERISLTLQGLSPMEYRAQALAA
ncbi:IS3 family transposase (plasmid) [Glutamicibacter bergerei]|uniref:IS3 family transposase n=1 Tax=Paeniglutamicibacter sp. ZC-3 TaxID=2986919 RepID=UPI0021F7DBC4|nr:IS3 family transposase [Paeniglutamicibacter sp. ZC-3]MCV9996460.1 IS3 family transposase [Paeniglutamicibacter sp. ZC-3]